MLPLTALASGEVCMKRIETERPVLRGALVKHDQAPLATELYDLPHARPQSFLSASASKLTPLRYKLDMLCKNGSRRSSAASRARSRSRPPLRLTSLGRHLRM